MKVFAALKEDVHQGWVWLQDSSLKSRSIVRISNPATGQKTYCEAMQFERNFLNSYKGGDRYPIECPANSIVMGRWYRYKLGVVETQADVDLRIEAYDCWWGRFLACLDHPQVIVRVAAQLGALSVVLGAVGVVFGVLGICLAL